MGGVYMAKGKIHAATVRPTGSRGGAGALLAIPSTMDPSSRAQAQPECRLEANLIVAREQPRAGA